MVLVPYSVNHQKIAVQMRYKQSSLLWCIAFFTFYCTYRTGVECRHLLMVYRLAFFIVHVGVDPWVDRGTSPPTFEVERTPCVLSPPTFSGVDVFCTNVHGIRWMIGAIFVKFSQLILVKIHKIVATICQILGFKCTKFNFGWGSAPDPAGGAYNAPPDFLAGFKGTTSKGMGGERREWRKGRGPLYFFRRIYAHDRSWSLPVP